MSKARAATPAPKHAPEAAPAGGLFRSWVRFWFTPADPIGLHALRVLTGVLFLCWLLPFAGHESAFFGLQGWFDRRAYSEAARFPGGSPQPITWSALYLLGSNPALLAVAFWATVLVLVLYTAGAWTRVTAVLAWVLMASFMANPATIDDADPVLLLLGFYLMLGYLLLGQRGRGESLAFRLLGPTDTLLVRRSRVAVEGVRRKSLGANVALRLLQVHFAIVIFTSGLHKLQFGDWWSGLALWYPLHPPFAAQGPGTVTPLTLWVLSLAAYAVLAWEIGFPAFAWRPRWRPVLLGGAVVGWLGAAFLYELPLFGPALIVGCLSYLTAAEWYRITGLLARLPGLGRLAGRPAAAPEELSPRGAQREAATTFA